MPIFAFVALRSRTDLDRRRQRVGVCVRPDAGGEALFLGDVWCSTATNRWYFTSGPSNPRRMGKTGGFRTREEAARALLDERIAAAETHLHEAVAGANTLRRIAGEDPLVVSTAPTLP